MFLSLSAFPVQFLGSTIGNDGYDDMAGVCEKNYINVAAVNDNGNALDALPQTPSDPYSNHGFPIRLLAPGRHNVPSLTVNNGYQVVQGTSFAAPALAGAYALKLNEFHNQGWILPPMRTVVLDSMTQGSAYLLTPSTSPSHTRPVVRLQTGFNYPECTYCKIYIKMNNLQTGQRLIQVFFKTNTDNTYSESKSAWGYINGNGVWNDIEIDLSLNPLFKGTITGIRLDPITTGTGQFGIDYIKIGDYDRWASYLLSWDFNGNNSGWTLANISATNNGQVLNGTSTSTDPYLSINTNFASGR